LAFVCSGSEIYICIYIYIYIFGNISARMRELLKTM
jgi:hypothetical protein